MNKNMLAKWIYDTEEDFIMSITTNINKKTTISKVLKLCEQKKPIIVDLIDRMFSWSGTPQGRTYWSRLSDQAYDNGGVMLPEEVVAYLKYLLYRADQSAKDLTFNSPNKIAYRDYR